MIGLVMDGTIGVERTGVVFAERLSVVVGIGVCGKVVLDCEGVESELACGATAMIGLVMDGKIGVEKIGFVVAERLAVVVSERLAVVTALVDMGASSSMIEEEVGIVVT